jgi:hypothetical protein
MLAAVEAHRPGSLVALSEDPLGELARWSEIQLVMAPESEAGSGCSIAGRYDDRIDPPSLIIGTARSGRRRGFTALHELGHHLQRTSIALGQRLFDVHDTEGLEEASCDEFAARLLLPDDLVASSIGERGPTAADVVELFDRSGASREACCVRGADRLVGAGVVVLLDRTGTVLFAAPRGLIPPARGSDQSTTPLISAALKQQSDAQRDETYIIYRTSNTSEHLYGQAAWCDADYLVAVLASDNVPWLPLALPRPGSGHVRYGSWWTCEVDGCGETFAVTEPSCQQCRQCRHPRCSHGHCGCTAARARRDRTCTRCQLRLPPNCFDGSSSVCRDCS